MRKVVFLTVLMAMFSLVAKASHNNGGEITYESLGGGTYKIKMILFVDCSSFMPDTIAFRTTSASCAINRFDTLYLSYKEDASQVCDTLQTTCNGGSVQGQTKWVYEANVGGFGLCNDWILSYTQCCRSSAPSNIVNPFAANFYIETTFDNSIILNNKSPYFADNPRWLIPVNGSNLINAGAYDSDGDSLHFSIVAPQSSNAVPLNFMAGYSATQPFGGGSTSIDPKTGIIFTLAPNTGQFIVGVKVDEFRNGQLLSSVRRDFVTNVYVSANTLPQISNSSLNLDLCTVDTLELSIYSSDATDTVTTRVLDSPYSPGIGFPYGTPPYNEGSGNLLDTNILWWDLYGYGVQPDKEYFIYINVEDEVCPVKNVQSYAVVVSTSYCVWPGDANNDLVADIYDVLPLGVYYSNTGNTRAGASLNWEGQWSQNWGTKQITGDDIKHADCNGDGIIDANDTTAILLNYNLTHLKAGGNELAGVNDPDLYVDIIPDTIGTSTPLSIPIMLGTSSVPADSVYGIVLRMSYDPTKIDSVAGVTVDYSNSWLGTEGIDMITLDTNFFNNGQIDIGLVRTDGQMINNGIGEILTLNVITIDNLSGKSTSFGSLVIDFVEVKIISLNEDEIPYNQQLDSVVIKDIASSITDVNTNNAIIAPNPNKGKFIIKSNKSIEQVEVYNTVGQQINVEISGTGSARTINLSDNDKGIYLVRVLYKDDSFSISKLMIK